MRDTAALGDLVAKVERDRTVLDEVEEQVGDVARKQLACVKRHRRRHIACTDDHYVGRHGVLPRSRELDVTPVSAARSTITDPRRMPFTMSAVTSSGARRPGIAAV